jgi:acyl dehydratase
MEKELSYESIAIGYEIPALVRRPILKQLVMWAGAVRDFTEIHYNKENAILRGYPDIIIHGALRISFFGEMMKAWVGNEGTLKKLDCKFSQPAFLNEDLTSKGKVIKKYVKDGEGYVELDLWSVNPRGEIPSRGTAIVAFPLAK